MALLTQPIVVRDNYRSFLVDRSIVEFLQTVPHPEPKFGISNAFPDLDANTGLLHRLAEGQLQRAPIAITTGVAGGRNQHVDEIMRYL